MLRLLFFYVIVVNLLTHKLKLLGEDTRIIFTLCLTQPFAQEPSRLKK
jgi:hypothetical protein